MNELYNQYYSTSQTFTAISTQQLVYTFGIMTFFRSW